MIPLVSRDWLAERLGTRGIKVVDASWYLPATGRDPHAEYRARHIPGALFWDLDEMSTAGDPRPHMMPPVEEFAAALGRLGVGPADQVVVYDDSGTNFSAARAWWQLRAIGHQSVAVLDGGLRGWSDAGLALASGDEPLVPVEYPVPPGVRGFHSREDVLALLDRGHVQLLDARSPGRFAGTEPEPRPGVRSGHIPGSVNLPIARLVDGQGRVLPPPALKGVLRDAGVDLQRPVVALCGSGVTACAILLALETLGHQDHAVYDGSWTEWGSDPDLPASATRD